MIPFEPEPLRLAEVELRPREDADRELPELRFDDEPLLLDDRDDDPEPAFREDDADLPEADLLPLLDPELLLFALAPLVFRPLLELELLLPDAEAPDLGDLEAPVLLDEVLEPDAPDPDREPLDDFDAPDRELLEDFADELFFADELPDVDFLVEPDELDLDDDVDDFDPERDDGDFELEDFDPPDFEPDDLDDDPAFEPDDFLVVAMIFLRIVELVLKTYASHFCKQCAV